MNPNDIFSLLGGLGSTPNWQYQLGLAQLQPQEQANTYNYQLGQSQLANQLQEFQAQQALAAAQQQWQQQFSTTGQQEQFGLQSGAQQFSQAQQAQQQALQNALFPWVEGAAAAQVPNANQALTDAYYGFSLPGADGGGGGTGGSRGGAAGGAAGLTSGNLVTTPWGKFDMNNPSELAMYSKLMSTPGNS